MGLLATATDMTKLKKLSLLNSAKLILFYSRNIDVVAWPAAFCRPINMILNNIEHKSTGHMNIIGSPCPQSSLECLADSILHMLVGTRIPHDLMRG